MSVLFSETKERENRFITALKISVPFTCVLIVFGIILFRNGEFKFDDVILLLILLICYVYYVIYQIYFGFQKTLIDPVTHVFVREEIEKILSNDLAKNHQINISSTYTIDTFTKTAMKFYMSIVKNFQILWRSRVLRTFRSVAL